MRGLQGRHGGLWAATPRDAGQLLTNSSGQIKTFLFSDLPPLAVAKMGDRPRGGRILMSKQTTLPTFTSPILARGAIVPQSGYVFHIEMKRTFIHRQGGILTTFGSRMMSPATDPVSYKSAASTRLSMLEFLLNATLFTPPVDQQQPSQPPSTVPTRRRSSSCTPRQRRLSPPSCWRPMFSGRPSESTSTGRASTKAVTWAL